MSKDNQHLSLRKLEYLKKTLDEVISQPYKANPALIAQILENLSTVSYLKISQLHSMALNTQYKQIEESQIAFIKNNWQKEKQDLEQYRKDEMEHICQDKQRCEYCKKKAEVIEFVEGSDWKVAAEAQGISLSDFK